MRNGALAALMPGVPLALGVAAGRHWIGRELHAAQPSERFVTEVRAISTVQYLLAED